MTRMNESKTLKKHISCKYKCKFDGRKCNSNQNWNNDKCHCECKNPKRHHVSERKLSLRTLLHALVKVVNI